MGWFAAAASILLALSIWLQNQFAQRTGSVTPDGNVLKTTYAAAPENRSWTRDGDLPSFELPPTAPLPTAEPYVAIDVTNFPEPLLARETALITREDAEVLDAAAWALALLKHSDDTTFAKVEQARRFTEYEQLLPKFLQID